MSKEEFLKYLNNRQSITPKVYKCYVCVYDILSKYKELSMLDIKNILRKEFNINVPTRSLMSVRLSKLKEMGILTSETYCKDGKVKAFYSIRS